MENSSDVRLMFLLASEFDSGKVVRGAFLTTDRLTKPLEFRCTSPITPTGLQKILYGAFLQQHMLVDLIALPLWRAATEKPVTMILVVEDEFLPLRKKLDIPLLWVGKHEGSAHVLPQEANVDSHIVTSSSGSFEPIIVAAHRDYHHEVADARTTLAEIMRERSVLEPFERIAVALEHVHRQQP